MTVEELAIKHQMTDDRSVRNEGRIKKLEAESKTLHDLATSVAVMAEQLKRMNTNVSTLTSEMEQIKEKPAKRCCRCRFSFSKNRTLRKEKKL